VVRLYVKSGAAYNAFGGYFVQCMGTWLVVACQAQKTLSAATHFILYIVVLEHRDSSVGMAMVGVRFLEGARVYFFSQQRPDRLWGRPSLLSSGYRGVKRPECEAGHFSLSSAEVKKGGAIPPLPHMFSCRVARLIEHRENFTVHSCR
jgi:hypothetical protein